MSKAQASHRSNRCSVLGITGGIASGKSTLAQWFEKWGAARISADEIARELLAPGSEMTRVVLKHFGSTAAQEGEPETVDRRKLARLIYADEAARRSLGEMMHPVIRERMRLKVNAFLCDGACRLIAAEIPLLYENGLEAMVDFVLVAECSEREQVARLRARQTWLTSDDALRQVRSQLPLCDKAARADFVISTEQPITDTERDARALFERLTQDSSTSQG